MHHFYLLYKMLAYLFWCWIPTQSCSNLVRVGLSNCTAASNCSNWTMGKILHSIASKVVFLRWSISVDIYIRLFRWEWIDKKTQGCLLFPCSFIEPNRQQWIWRWSTTASRKKSDSHKHVKQHLVINCS